MDSTILLSGLVGSILGACLSWVGAVHAATRVHQIDAANRTKGTRLALRVEIETIRSALLRVSELPSARPERVRFLASEGVWRLMSVYAGASMELGRLPIAEIRGVVAFYSMTSALAVAADDGGAGDRGLLERSDVANLISLADKAIEALGRNNDWERGDGRSTR